MNSIDPNKNLEEAYQNLPPNTRKIVSQKKLAGTYSPDEIIDSLLELRGYIKPVKASEKTVRNSKPLFKRGDIGYYALAIGVVFLLYLFIGKSLQEYLLIGAAICLAGYLGWMAVKAYQRSVLSNKLIEWRSLNFLLQLVSILKDEIRPGAPIQLSYSLDSKVRRKYYFKTLKNYLFLNHRIVIRGFWYIIFLAFIYSVLSMVWPDMFPEYIPMYVFPVVLPMFMILYFIVLGIASAVYGKSPRVKTRLYRIPQVSLRTQLADGTLFQVETFYMLGLKTAHKKKFKSKNFQVTKIKKKYKLKSITLLKMAFPQKKYQMSDEDFERRFNYRPHLSGRRIAKVKVKPGQKRKTVIYQDVQSGQGTGHGGVKFLEPNLGRLLELVMTGGYNQIRKQGNESGEADIQRDNLAKIVGIGQTTERTLNDWGIYSYRQLANMNMQDVGQLVHEKKIRQADVLKWQTQARAFMNDQQNLNPSQNTKDTKPEIEAERNDLTRISGIGRSSEIKLNNIGIVGYQQIIEMSQSDFAEMLKGLNLPHHKAADWQAQARHLLG